MPQMDHEPEVMLPDYMTRFRCIGSACEEHCCQRWRIVIDRGNYKLMQKALGRSPEDRKKFDRSFKRSRSSLDKDSAFAQLALNAKGCCPFVEPSGLCEIHRRFGADHLSHTCRVYPRKFKKVAGRLELAGALSCPELARLCLLAPDGTRPRVLPLASLSLEATQFGADAVAAAPGPYGQYAHAVRDIVTQLLSARDYPLEFRLFLVGYFANRLAPFFHQKTSSFTEDLLIAEVDRLADPGIVAELYTQYPRLEASLELPMNIVQTILLTRSANSSFRDLSVKVWAEYGVVDEDQQRVTFDRHADGALDSRQLLPRYQERRQQLRRRFADRLDQYVERYCTNYWFAECYVAAPDLLVHTQNLLVRLAILTFLLYGHPDLVRLGASNTPLTALDEELLDRTAVEVFYKFSRAIEHDAALALSLSESLDEQRLRSFAHMVQILKFI